MAASVIGRKLLAGAMRTQFMDIAHVVTPRPRPPARAGERAGWHVPLARAPRELFHQGLHGATATATQRRTITNLPSERKEYLEAQRILGYSMEQMYEIVNNVDDYKHFVPWCKESQTITKSPKDGLSKAILEVGFPPLVERYTSVITSVRPHLVKAVSSGGTFFDHMETTWRFGPGPPDRPLNTCTVDFRTSFQFRPTAQLCIGPELYSRFFREVFEAFERRAGELYGPATCIPRESRDAQT